MKRISSVLIASLLLLTSNISSPVFATAPVEISLGYQGPISGPNSQFGADQLAGVNEAISAFNSTHTDFHVNLIQIDSQGDPTIASTVSSLAAANPNLLGVIGESFAGAAFASVAA